MGGAVKAQQQFGMNSVKHFPVYNSSNHELTSGSLS